MVNHGFVKNIHRFNCFYEAISIFPLLDTANVCLHLNWNFRRSSERCRICSTSILHQVRSKNTQK
ncbi:hypothetical protein BT96DRAFT_641058 [Gymnopus androsaceus JB14]|uniref:Uncharacterized protein n=1 Tax=Gymnopus androsaceus JB14 TaxID=1447944 RepID=A0A6A4GGI4_9AGAR|nr:hypothetical protein BT96DRAFT_641058 [Gymnopus androsaceus JB14]